jgi:aminoglycoside phosphotransferase (APT) family kinase protein
LGPKGEWFTRQYLTTKVLGTIHTVKMPLHISDVPKFRNLFHALQAIPKISGTTFERRGGDFYLSMSEGCLRSAKAYFSGSDVQRIRHFLHGSFLLLDRTGTHMVHGDCHPGNILYDRAHTFVIDWELMHINNRVNDFGYFYAGLAPHPAFRRTLLRSYAASLSWKKEFRQLFPVNVLFFTLNHLATLKHGRPKELSAREYARVLAFAKQVVKRAITSYTALEQL